MTASDIIMHPHKEDSSDSTSEEQMRWNVHVEVRLNPRTATRYDTVRTLVQKYLSTCNRIGIPSTLEGWKDNAELRAAVEQISVAESACPYSSMALEESALQIHIYQPVSSDSFEEFSNSGGSRDSEDDTMAATVCELPNRAWEGLWDSLIYADDIKIKLLDYIHATLVLSDVDVDFNLVSWNRIVLLHGPPGTGKTSLCRALAQKLSIRLSHRYTHARLLEINSHSLFSKWFSESGKLVQRLFNSVTELIDEDDAFLVILIDEVESLTAARAGAMAGTEPSDGLRVVNALLTQLDKLKHRKNVLIMATSNLVKAIDTAFVDRADIVQYVDLPPREAIYAILRSCLQEMIKRGIVSKMSIPTMKEALVHEISSKAAPSMSPSSKSSGEPYERSRHVATRLLGLSSQCRAMGMSGRALRRLPVLALAGYIGLRSAPPKSSTSGSGTTSPNFEPVGVEVWLDGLERVVNEKSKQMDKII